MGPNDQRDRPGRAIGHPARIGATVPDPLLMGPNDKTASTKTARNCVLLPRAFSVFSSVDEPSVGLDGPIDDTASSSNFELLCGPPHSSSSRSAASSDPLLGVPSPVKHPRDDF